MDPEKKHRKIQYSFLKEYASGEASEEKKQQIADWLEDPELYFKLEVCLKQLWEETSPDSADVPGGLKYLLDRIHHEINIRQPVKTTGSRQERARPNLVSTLKYISRIAAILLLPVMSYLGWKAINRDLFIRNQAELTYNEIVCPLGARSRFDLPDGTTGWLNNGSSLKYPARFESDIREVELEGEAFFDVTHFKSRPFIIKTQGLDVKVHGTRLNVYAYPNEPYQTFTLETGSIELIKMNDGKEISILRMKPGQHAVYALNPEDQTDVQSLGNPDKTIIIGDRSLEETYRKSSHPEGTVSVPNGKINIEYDEPSLYTDWRKGKLILRNDPMPIMLKRIERWYNVRFNVSDEKINQYRYWATFEDENLDQVLKMLTLTGPILFEKQIREQEDDGTFKPQVIDIRLKN